jgi:hypothetical protein
MILEIVIYIVTVLVIAVSISLFLEALTDLVKGLGSKGKRDLIVSVSAVGFSHYFFKECTGYFNPSPRFDFEYWYFLLAGLLSLGIVTAVREIAKSYKKTLDAPTPESLETRPHLEDLDTSSASASKTDD